MDDFRKLGKQDMVSRIMELDRETQELGKEMDKAAKAVDEHFSRMPPDLPGRKHRRAFKQWHEQAIRKNDRFERVKDEVLQKCEQFNKMIEIYRQIHGGKEVKQVGGEQLPD